MNEDSLFESALCRNNYLLYLFTITYRQNVIPLLLQVDALLFKVVHLNFMDINNCKKGIARDRPETF